MRREHQCQHQQHPAIREHRGPSGQRPPRQRRRPAGQRRVVAPLRDLRRQRERADREHDHDERDHVADRILESDRRDAQVGLRGQHVGDIQHERRPEIVEDLDEHERRAGDEPRSRQRKHDAAEEPEAVAPQILRRLFHCAVDVAKRSDQVEQNERKVVEALDEDDAVEAVHERDANSERLREQKVYRAVAAEEELQGHRAHERWHHEGQHAERLHEGGAAELEAHGEVGERHCDQRGERHRGERHDEAVDERLAHQRDRQKCPDVAEREPALAIGECRVEHRGHGPGEKDDDEGRDRQREQPGAARGGADSAGGGSHRCHRRRARAAPAHAAGAGALICVHPWRCAPSVREGASRSGAALRAQLCAPLALRAFPSGREQFALGTALRAHFTAFASSIARA